MLIAILILTVFNTGLVLLVIGGLNMCKNEIISYVAASTKRIEEDIENATTAIYNMDSIKQKVDMNGSFEI
jgi:hypothetical protein